MIAKVGGEPSQPDAIVVVLLADPLRRRGRVLRMHPEFGTALLILRGRGNREVLERIDQGATRMRIRERAPISLADAPVAALQPGESEDSSDVGGRIGIGSRLIGLRCLF